MNNFKSLFGKKGNDDYDNYYGQDDEMDDVTPYGEGKDDGVNVAAVSLKVVKPKSYADGPSIADHLTAGSTVVLNIESLDRASAIRLIDFLMGAIHVLGGDMKSVTKTTLVFAPRNVGVTDFENAQEVEEAEEAEEIEE